VVGGVIGETRSGLRRLGRYGEHRPRGLDANAPVNGVAISEITWLRARDRTGFGAPVVINLKGVGDVAVYLAQPLVEADPALAVMAQSA